MNSIEVSYSFVYEGVKFRGCKLVPAVEVAILDEKYHNLWVVVEKE